MAAEKPLLSPVMQEYVSFKERYPDCVVFYRLGDFYEIFFDDARAVSAALSLVLTHRGRVGDAEIPMCGIPFHAAENYINRLVSAGFKVAIAEQLESPAEMKSRGGKQIRREVVRVLTAGTIVDDSALVGARANYLMAIYISSQNLLGVSFNEVSVAWCDISTGDYFVRDFGRETEVALDEILRIAPSEILFDESFAENDFVKKIRAASGAQISFIHSREFDKSDKSGVMEMFGISQNEFEKSGKAEKVVLCMLCAYISRTQVDGLVRFKGKPQKSAVRTLQIDSATWNSLDIDGSGSGGEQNSLLSVIDKTRTAFGARKLRGWLGRIELDLGIINGRADAIGFFIGRVGLIEKAQKILTPIPDVARALSRVANMRARPRDLSVVLEFLRVVPEIKSFDLPVIIADKFSSIQLHDELAQKLQRALCDELPANFSDGLVIREGFSAGLDRMRDLDADSKQTIAELQGEYIQKTGVANLRIKFNNLFGYFVEVPAAKASVLMDSQGFFIHRQTMTNVMRFTTEKLTALENEIRSAADNARALEMEIINELSTEITNATDDIRDAIDCVAEVDAIGALAAVARDGNWARPVVVDAPVFNVRGGRHPIVEAALRRDTCEFIPNDCDFTDKKIHLMTGPNMAGKSTFLRQNAIIVILAMCGFYIPAESGVVGIVDSLFSRVGASDNLSAGQSTFMVEMVETAAILRRATANSFIILDEIGRGTATFDGMAIAWSVLEFLDMLGARTLFATHYHELVDLQKVAKNIGLTTVEVREENGQVYFMHRVIVGSAGRSFGIAVAERAGLPASVIVRAKEVLAGFEAENGAKVCAPRGVDFVVGESAQGVGERLQKELDKIDINQISPMEALMELDRLKKFSALVE